MLFDTLAAQYVSPKTYARPLLMKRNRFTPKINTGICDSLRKMEASTPNPEWVIMANARNKKFEMKVAGVAVHIEASSEGECRYMVRMTIPGRTTGAVRIGYLTGRGRNWLAEFFGGNRASVPATSAKMACEALGEWAAAQSSIAPYLGDSNTPTLRPQ